MVFRRGGILRSNVMAKYKVKQSELWVGREFKNYKEICASMGWTIYKGGSNGFKAQIKELETYCNWQRSGHKYTITEVYGQALEKKDGRKGNVRINETQGLAEQVLINLLANAEHVGGNDKVLRVTKFQLFQSLGLINQNFNICFKHPDITQELLETSSVATRYFLERTYDKADDKVKTLFKNMERRNLLIKHDVIIYCDSNGDLKKADEDIESLIVSVKRKCMNDMGYKTNDTENAIIADGRWQEYSKMVNRKLNKRGIRYYYKAYDIIVSDYYSSMVKELYEKQCRDGVTLGSLTERINALTLESNTKTFSRKANSVKKEAPSLGIRDKDSLVILSDKWKEDGDTLFSACGDITNKEHLEPKIKEKLKEKKQNK